MASERLHSGVNAHVYCKVPGLCERPEALWALVRLFTAVNSQVNLNNKVVDQVNCFWTFSSFYNEVWDKIYDRQ